VREVAAVRELEPRMRSPGVSSAAIAAAFACAPECGWTLAYAAP
jgi:hypothetical protein